MQYLSYILKPVITKSGLEGQQPLLLFKRWPFRSGISFGSRYLVAIDTTDDLTDLIASGAEFDLRAENPAEIRLLAVARMRGRAAELRKEANDIDLRITAGSIEI